RGAHTGGEPARIDGRGSGRLVGAGGRPRPRRRPAARRGPPMSGPATGAAVLRAEVGEAPLDVAEHAALVDQAAAGAVVTFAGVVRDHDGGRAVRALEYSAHPTAGKVVAEVAADVAARAVG